MRLRFWAVLGVITVGIMMRWLPHPPNFTPVAAMALFGGTYFVNKRLAFVIPMVAMFIGDLFLGMHVLMPVVYVSFLVTVVLGMTLRERRNGWLIAGASLASSAFFFVTTNFAAWLVLPEYTKNLAGLVTCFVAAIPFFGHTLIGDLFYTLVFFGVAEVMLKKCPKLCTE